MMGNKNAEGSVRDEKLKESSRKRMMGNVYGQFITWTDEMKERRSNSYRGRKNANAVSKYMGVSYEKKHNIWKAAIRVGGKSLRLGRFSTEIEAALAYNEAEIYSYGENAKLNVINIEDIPREGGNTHV